MSKKMIKWLSFGILFKNWSNSKTYYYFF
jgi:hypothetical protein